MKEFLYKIFIISCSVFCKFSFLLEIVKREAMLSPRGWNKSGLQSKNILFPILEILTSDFERVSILCAQIIQNVWFRPVIEFTFSYAIQEKFTA